MTALLLQELDDLAKNKNVDIAAIYTSLSNLDSKSIEDKGLFPEIQLLLDQRKLRKDLIYIALLANPDSNLLEAFEQYQKQIFTFDIENPTSLYDYCVYNKKHWLYELLATCENHPKLPCAKRIYNKLLILKLVQITNSSTVKVDLLSPLLSRLDKDYLPDFWNFYANEIEHWADLVQFCYQNNDKLNKHEVFNFATTNSLLATLSKYVDLSDHENWEQVLIKIQQLDGDTDEKQLQLFQGYTVLASFIDFIIKKPQNDFRYQKINEIIDNFKTTLFNIKDKNFQLELLENIFSLLFYTSHGEFHCGEKEVRLVLYLLNSVINELNIKRVYENLEIKEQLTSLGRHIKDALWRLDLVVNVKPNLKKDWQLVEYMLAPPESLIHLCVKGGDTDRAEQVIEIFQLQNSDLAQELHQSEKLLHLRDYLRSRAKSSGGSPLTLKILEKFIPFKEDVYGDLLDFALIVARTKEDANFLLSLVEEKATTTPSKYANFYRKVIEMSKDIDVPAAQILSSSDYPLDIYQYKCQEDFYVALADLYDQFLVSMNQYTEGSFNRSHECHDVFLKINELCTKFVQASNQGDCVQYLSRVNDYLKAFSNVLYIEGNNTDLVTRDRNTSHFELLKFNRSELMGRLLFERHLELGEFERYFNKMKLDFLYHLVGNCFPTINLHVPENITIDELYHDNMLYVPSKNIIIYIQKRNWLLAFLLNEMYHIEGVKVGSSETKLHHFFNYLKLDRIQNLKALFEDSAIIAALQNCISAQKVKLYFEEHVVKQDLISITSENSDDELETGEEIFEDKRITNWKQFYNIMKSIPEIQLRKKIEFVRLMDTVLMNLVQDNFDLDDYKLVYFITNRDQRFETILNNFKKWPGECALDVIWAELTRFDIVEDARLELLKDWMLKIEVNEKLRQVFNVPTWHRCYEFCNCYPEMALQRILEEYNVKILLEFISIYKPSEEILLNIEVTYITKVIELETPFDQIKRLLDNLPFNHTINICNNLLTILRKLEYLNYIAEYINHNVPDDIFVKNVQVSLKILSVFTPTEQDQMFSVIHEPLNIIEILIMNTKFDKLGRVLEILNLNANYYDTNIISMEKIDELLRKYAEKSLEFRVITQPLSRIRTPEFKLMQSLDSLLISSDRHRFIVPDHVPTKEEWTANDEVVECMCCQQILFSMFNRRHHCRRCGRVVCYNCSQRRMLIPCGYDDIPVRVCEDCFHQTVGNSGSSERSDTSSWKSYNQEHWLLNDDPHHNQIIREEFSYEHAPSVSLCLSLLKYHSKNVEYPKFLLAQCEVMLKMLQPIQGSNEEIDYLLVIKMLKSLALAAKMSSAEHHLNSGISTADRIISQADLLALLAERGCLNLLPSVPSQSTYIDSNVVRRLKDKLLELEQWDLALEISTKSGFDNTGVFTAWGKSCLKSGRLLLAREKFQRVFERASHYDSLSLSKYSELSQSCESLSRSMKSSSFCSTSESRPSKDPSLLHEIIRILESKTRKIDPKAHRGLDPSLSVINRIKNLKKIVAGTSVLSRKDVGIFRPGLPIIDKVFFDECVYYLSKYGSYFSLLEFYVRHRRINAALNFIIDTHLSPDLFVSIYMMCLKDGLISPLQDEMSNIDSSLIVWKDYLKFICRHLEKYNLLHSLYQLQLFMCDYVRATMTCLRFYRENVKNFTELARNNNHLLRAEEHLKQIIDQDQWVEISSVGGSSVDSRNSFEEKLLSNPDIVMKLDIREVHKHLASIKTQKKVTEFLAECESADINVLDVIRDLYEQQESWTKNDKFVIPFLFGTGFEKISLAVALIVADPEIEKGYAIASDLIKEFKLRAIKIYCLAGSQLARAKRFNDIIQLVNCIQHENGKDQVILDEMLSICVGILLQNESSDTKVTDLIKLIRDVGIRISACIEAKQLMTAYYLSVKYKRPADIRRVKREAELLNMTNIVALCEKGLKNYPEPENESLPQAVQED